MVKDVYKRQVVTISGKAVKLIDKYAFKGVLVAVGNHALELQPIICCSALRTVDILSLIHI